MSTKDAYKQKIEAELELLQATFAEYKAKAKLATADARITYARQIEEVEQKMEVTRGKLKELGEAGDGAWEVLRSGVEKAWNALNDALRDPFIK